jgi:hypothetical protein
MLLIPISFTTTLAILPAEASMLLPPTTNYTALILNSQTPRLGQFFVAITGLFILTLI